MLDTLSDRVAVPVETLKGMLRQARRPASASRSTNGGLNAGPLNSSPASALGTGMQIEPSNNTTAAPIRQSELDPDDVELIRIILNEPIAVTRLIPRIGVSTLRDEPLRAILQACYDLQSEGQTPSYEQLMIRIDDRAVRGLIVDLVSQTCPGNAGSRPPCPRMFVPLPGKSGWKICWLCWNNANGRLGSMIWEKRSVETDPNTDPDTYRAIELEYRRLLTSRGPRKT